MKKNNLPAFYLNSSPILALIALLGITQAKTLPAWGQEIPEKCNNPMLRHMSYCNPSQSESSDEVQTRYHIGDDNPTEAEQQRRMELLEKAVAFVEQERQMGSDPAKRWSIDLVMYIPHSDNVVIRGTMQPMTTPVGIRNPHPVEDREFYVVTNGQPEDWTTTITQASSKL